MRCTLQSGGDIGIRRDDPKEPKLGVLLNEALDGEKREFFVAKQGDSPGSGDVWR